MPRIEACASFAAGLASRDQLGHDARARHAVTKGPLDGLARVLGYLQADLVVQDERSHGKAERGHRAIHVLDAGAFGEHERRLIHHHAQHTRGVKARRITHHDDGLAHPCAQRDGHLQGAIGSAVGTDDLEQRHPLGG